jgi:tetratricopeptide (TPR) repeat protein
MKKCVFRLVPAAALFTVLLACASAPAPAPESPAVSPPSPAEVRSRVWTLIGEKSYDEAGSLLQSAIDSLGDVREIPYIENGTLYVYGEQRVASAISLFLLFAHESPDAKDVAAWKSSEMPRLLELEKTVSWDKVKVLDPVIPYLYYQMGFLLIEAEEFKDALGYLEEAIRLWPDFTTAYNEIAAAYIQLADFAAAKKAAAFPQKRVLASMDRTALAMVVNKLGFIAIEEGHWDLAERYYNDSLELNPDNRTAKDELEYIRQNRGK